MEGGEVGEEGGGEWEGRGRGGRGEEGVCLVVSVRVRIYQTHSLRTD